MREAARRGIETAGLHPILVNEDLPSSPATPRNACLDEIDRSDIFAIVIGGRGGSKAPSGKLVIEEEYEHAFARGKPILVFVQNVSRDPEVDAFVLRISNYLSGHFRVTFEDETDLEEEISRAARKQGAIMKIPAISATDLDADLTGSRVSDQNPSLRLVVAPQRDEELVSVVRTEEEDFWFDVNELAHSRQVQFFSYAAATFRQNTLNGIWFSQRPSEGYRREELRSSIEIRHSGRLILDRAIESEPIGDFPGRVGLLEKDVLEVLRTAFRFSFAFYEKFDRQARHSEFWYAALIANPGMNYLLKEPSRGGGSFNLRSGQEKMVVAEPPRSISRSQLAAPVEFEQRLLIYFRRKLAAPDGRD